MENHETDKSVTVPSLRRFFSLKWQALLFTSLVLVAVTVAISWRSYVNLNTQFDRHRQAAHERYAKEVRVVVDQSLDRLRQLGSWLPSLPGMQQGFIDGDPERIKQSFESQWPVLQLDLGIDVVGFYDTESKLLAHWEVMQWNEGHVGQAIDWIRQVNAREIPLTALYCSPDCLQYAVVPVLAAGRSVGAVLLGSSLADVIWDFRLVSGNDIGLLASGRDGFGDADPARHIPQWDVRVVALTNVAHNLKVLKQVASTLSLAEALEGVRTTFDGRSYEIRFIPLPGFDARQTTQLVVIADITTTLNEIRVATQEILIVGISGWLLSELLLLAILWTPMSRLRLTARNLPLLAQSEFKSVRTAIAGRSQRRLVSDEIDILDRTAMTLASRLERLEKKVEDRTRALSQRMEELARERDFVASLLDIAQVMIIAQDRRGRIVMTNRFTQSLTGYTESELAGRAFTDLLLSEELSPDMLQRLKELIASQHGHLRHEALVIGKDGSIRDIIWYHSRLTGHFPDDPVMLSVGLDITERRGAESRLAWLADHDTLTGLLNRRRFQEELELVIAAAERQDKTGALLVIDLDQFKYVNDTSGHHTGDTLLKAVADALSTHITAADVVARLGGDEFAVLVRETDAEGAIQVAAKINNVLSDLGIIVGEQTLRVSASIGIALFPIHSNNVNELLAGADIAMYQAKEEGGGHWHLFSEEDKMRERMRNRIYWKDRISQALAEDQFVLYYQPIMMIGNGQISHYEVLLRMRDADGHIIGAAHFIDAAERSGMIHAVDRLVVSKAIHYLAKLNRDGWDVSFSVNLSGHAFNDPDLLPHLRRELERSRVDTAKVIFEITETAAVSDFAVANNLMLIIKELGCRFALDDFGIGFSSFYYLKHLPVDYLKIDGSFIRQLPDNPDDQIIVKALGQVAAGFGKKTIAEYVENQETLALLREYGIDYAQGYFISQPRCAEEIFGCSVNRVERSGLGQA